MHNYNNKDVLINIFFLIKHQILKTNISVSEDTTDPNVNAVLLGQNGEGYLVGPAGATGKVFTNNAQAVINNGNWTVTVELRKGAEGEEVRFKIFVTDGVITERENIEMEAETVEVEKLPETMSDAEEIKDEAEVDVVNLEEVSKVVEEMSYRIEELEKKIAKMEEVIVVVPEEKEEEELPMEMSSVQPLNGAPMASKPITNTRKNASPQSAFLKKLYN